MVTADDRTGAYEVAAEIAAAVGPVVVSVDDAPEGDGVVDLGSRHLSPRDAVRRAEAAPVAEWNAHKIDSTLRGNWVEEVRARARVTGQRVVVVPAWPAMGRTCVGGVVHVHGQPVGDIGDQLAEADLLANAHELQSWLTGVGRFAAVDVIDEPVLHVVAQVLASAPVLLVGPGGPIGAVFTARSQGCAASVVAECAAPALVVRGSATEISREQVARLVHAVPGIDVLEAPAATGDLVPAVALELAGRARARMADGRYATVVLIGGDTAAAVLGAAPRRVGGTVAPGMPWSRPARGDGPLVITKAGGFGDPDALVRLFAAQYRA
jgi:D-threonate/D-erythronate kinase